MKHEVMKQKQRSYIFPYKNSQYNNKQQTQTDLDYHSNLFLFNLAPPLLKNPKA